MGVPAHSWFTAENDGFLAELMREPVFLGAELARQHRVIAYDRVGLGESTSPGGPRSLSDGLAELTQVLKAHASGQVVLVGHSIGGLLAFEYARQQPERVHALVLLDSSHPHQLQRLSVHRDLVHQQAVEQQQRRIRDEHPER